MKVVLLTNFIPPYRKSLYQALAKRFEEFTILVSVNMEQNRDWTVDHEGLNVVAQKTISWKKKWTHEAGFEDTTEVHLPYNTISILRRLNPDVVISSELGMRSLLASLYCQLFQKPLILWLTLSDRTETNKGGMRLKLRSFLLKHAKAILCNGVACERYVKTFGIEKPVFFVPYTSNFEIGSAKTQFHQPRRFLYSGTLTKRKGIKEMVDAFVQWSHANPESGAELTIVGDGPEKVQLERLSPLKNLLVKHIGSLPYAEMKARYHEADIYLMPTLADEWGVVINEAMSCGLPVLGSMYSQAVEQLVRPMENGWTFRTEETSEFAAGIQMALNTSNEVLSSYSRNCIDTIQELSVEKVADTIANAAKSVKSI
ncbi:MAG: glycosyltransferase family 4 protein [Flavobacteriales bacterium]